MTRRQTPVRSGFRAYLPLVAISLGVLILDQLTKTWVYRNLEIDASYYPPDWIPVVEGFFYIVHIGNEGAAWGMLSGQGGILTLFALAALLAIYKFRHSLELKRPPMQVAFGLLVGGVLGNLVDRLLHGHVIDFLDFHLPIAIPGILPDGRWPAFNVADCGIVVGVTAYVLISFLPAKRSPPDEHG